MKKTLSLLLALLLLAALLTACAVKAPASPKACCLSAQPA